MADLYAAIAAVLIGLVPRRDGVQVLLTRRTDGLRQHGGQVSFPGGRIDRADYRGAALTSLQPDVAADLAGSARLPCSSAPPASLTLTVTGTP